MLNAMGWVLRLGKWAAFGLVAYYVVGYLLVFIAAAIAAVALVWWLLASERAFLGE